MFKKKKKELEKESESSYQAYLIYTSNYDFIEVIGNNEINGVSIYITYINGIPLQFVDKSKNNGFISKSITRNG